MQEWQWFISEVNLSPLSAPTCPAVDSVFDLHNSTLSGILDKIIPFKIVGVNERSFNP